MWWILVIIIIAVVVMGSENEGKYKADKYKKDEQKQWEKQIAPYACVKYAKITYVAHNPYEEKFTLVHQIDVKTDSIYGRWYRYFVDSSAFTDYSKQSIILLDENKKEIPLQKNVHMMCEKLAEGCGNIVLTFDAQVEERETAHNVQWTLVMRGPEWDGEAEGPVDLRQRRPKRSEDLERSSPAGLVYTKKGILEGRGFVRKSSPFGFCNQPE